MELSVIGAMCSWLLAGVLLVAVASKVRSRHSRQAFRESVGRLLGLERRWATAVAIATTATEAIACGLLIIPLTVSIGIWLTAVLLSAFTAVMIRAVLVKAQTPCNCLGTRTSPVGWPSIWRNIGLLAVAGTALLITPDASRMASHELLLAALGAGAGTLMTMAWDMAADLFTPTRSATR